MSDNPITNIGDIAKPVTALIEKIADAANILYEPRHIREVAKAKAEAAVIEAESQIKITELHQRAVRRWIEEEARDQRNIESIIAKVINQLDEEADPHAIDNDWIVKFFDICRLVSDDKMQDLWASVLAGEANCTGSYSPKTLTTLASMNQKVATLFNTFCSLCVINLEDPNAFLKSPSNFKIRVARVPIIRGVIGDAGTLRNRSNLDIDEFAQKSESMYQKYDLGFNEFQLLFEYGLIQDDTFSYYPHFWYNNEIYGPVNPSANFPFKEEDYQQIKISGYNLSSVGVELFHIAKPDSPLGYLESLIDFLQEYYDVKIIRYSIS